MRKLATKPTTIDLRKMILSRAGDKMRCYCNARPWFLCHRKNIEPQFVLCSNCGRIYSARELIAGPDYEYYGKNPPKEKKQ